MRGVLLPGVLRTCIAGLETLGCLERSAERACQLPLTIHFFYLSLRYHEGSSICYARSRIFLRSICSPVHRLYPVHRLLPRPYTLSFPSSGMI